MLLGMVDVGRIFYAAIEVANAAGAGVEYGAASSANSTNLATIKSTALADAADVSDMTVTLWQRRVCTDTSGTPSNCVVCASGTCSVTAPNSVFVDVRTQATIRMLFPWPGLTNSSVTVHGNAHMRAQ